MHETGQARHGGLLDEDRWTIISLFAFAVVLIVLGGALQALSPAATGLLILAGIGLGIFAGVKYFLAGSASRTNILALLGVVMLTAAFVAVGVDAASNNTGIGLAGGGLLLLSIPVFVLMAASWFVSRKDRPSRIQPVGSIPPPPGGPRSEMPARSSPVTLPPPTTSAGPAPTNVPAVQPPMPPPPSGGIVVPPSLPGQPGSTAAAQWAPVAPRRPWYAAQPSVTNVQPVQATMVNPVPPGALLGPTADAGLAPSNPVSGVVPNAEAAAQALERIPTKPALLPLSNFLSEFEPSRRYENERHLNIELAQALRDRFGREAVQVELPIPEGRVDIEVLGVCVELKIAASTGSLQGLPEQLDRYVAHYGPNVIAFIFDDTRNSETLRQVVASLRSKGIRVYVKRFG